ncbi:MAG: DUF1254 domain-containing protein [Proteobacteria bacterium]|nr:DUF1254 domain-containing protein [Pseudomonadota bacterium]
MKARETLVWIATALAIAAIVHVGSVYALPRFIMSRAMAAMGTPNAIHHGKRADSDSRGVVRPSPDLLYSTCPYDLSKGPLRVHAAIPAGTYWSVSAFDANTDNFFARNDRQLRTRTFEFVVTGPGPGNIPLPPRDEIVISPTAKGLILFRTLVDSEDDLARVDAARRQATCEIISLSAPSSSKGG